MLKLSKIAQQIKTYGFILTLLLYPTYSIAHEAVPNDLLPGWNTIKQASLRETISYLSSDQLQGRLTLEKGDNLSIQWIATQFKIAGLKPVVGHSYLQSVKLIAYKPDTKHSYLALETPDIKKRWKKPEVLTEFYQNSELSGDVVFAGYGITAPELHYDDYQNVDVRGKIVFIFEHEPQENSASSVFNGMGNTRHATNRIKALNAQRHGAIAVLVAPEPNRTHPSNQERRMRIGGSVQRKIPAPSMVLKNDELHIPVAVVSDAVANDIAGKKLSLSQLQSTIDRTLKPQSQSMPNVKITLHNQNESRHLSTSYNVVGLLEGSDPTLKEETIIVSAHHDHEGISGYSIWHGADDNASGTAGVVALARAMVTNTNVTNGLKPKRSILFVVFTAEERGLLGAFYMAAHPLRPLITTRALINFDMIGRNETATPQTEGLINIPADTTNRLNLIGSHYSPDYQRTVSKQNEYVGLSLDNRFDNESALNVFFRSDQFPFVLHNVPAFWWFTGFHPDYHHTTDTADKINYVKLQKILRLAYLSSYAFADDKTPPRFIVNPSIRISSRF